MDPESHGWRREAAQDKTVRKVAAEETPLSEYWWKPKPESLRMIMVSVIVVLAQFMMTATGDIFTEPGTYLRALLVAVMVAVGHAVWTLVGPGGFTSK